jgi:hypothetical protein
MTDGIEAKRAFWGILSISLGSGLINLAVLKGWQL